MLQPKRLRVYARLSEMRVCGAVKQRSLTSVCCLSYNFLQEFS